MARNSGPGWLSVIVIALVVGALGGALGARWMDRYAPRTMQEIVRGRSTVSVQTETDAIVTAAREAAPAVVTITALSRGQAAGPFGLRGPAQTRRSSGSGFFFDYQGKKYVMTNTHVIAGAQELSLRTSDGQDYPAKLVTASQQDLAVLEAVGVPADQATLPLGDSDTAAVGSWVLAIGSPFGIDNTVTVGVVSRKGFTPMDQGGRDFIQTDASINSGNSGGPLIDLGGNVIGVNQMILSPTQTSLGIGFAIPVNQAKELLYFLVNRGPWVGVGTQPNSPGLSNYLELETAEGVVVAEVVPGSPAARAGLRRLDVILQVDGKAVKNPDELQTAILKHTIGANMAFLVQRGSQRMTVQVTGGTIPAGSQ
jgi:serine protease Do